MLPNKEHFVNWGIRSAMAVALLAGSAGFSNAQGWYRADSDRYERDHYRDYDRDRRGSSPVDSTMRDLERFARRTERRNSHRERVRFDNALRNLSKFQDRYYRGHFDKDRLDQAIEDVDNVVKHNPLDQRDRERLWNDLSNLRAFRETRGNFDYDRRRY
jgi:hypothetical protein